MDIYTKYKELLINNNKDGVKELFQDADATDLLEVILPRIVQNHAVKILNDILKSFAATEQAQVKRRKFVEGILTAIKKAEISSSHASSLVSKIVELFPKYSKLQLAYLVDFCLNSIRNNDDDFFSWKDILPEILQILEEEKFINHRGTEMSGMEYKSHIISSICNQPWELEILTPLATMFTKIRMEQNDHGRAIRTLCSKVEVVKHSELPPLVHQLLRLSDKQDGRLVIGTLQKYFTKMYAQSPNETPNAMDIDGIEKITLKEIQETESTILYHIHQSALLNHSSMKDFMRHLKNITNAPELILMPFSMSVLLLVSEIYEEQIFDILTQAITRKMQDDEKRNSSAWLQQILSDNCQLLDVMDQIINNSTKDRHLVIKGLVDFAFVLMESKSKENEKNLLHEIGIRIIEKLITKRHEIGPTVIERLTNNIFANGTSVAQYVECLNFMCRKLTLIVLDSQGWIITLLEQLLLIPGVAATQVLYATLPLIRISASIRNSLVLILRKALYRKGVDVRQMAVTGFLQFLTNLRIGSLNLSQSSINMNTSMMSGSIYTQATVEKSIQHRPNSQNNAAFCHEILGILKRCFYHECQVRQHLYKGLYDVVYCNSELAEYIIDMLLGNFKTYYESDEDVKPPLKFHNCCNVNGSEVFIEEPIGDLTFILQKIYCHMLLKGTPVTDQLGIYLESLCTRMARTELEHLNVNDEKGDLLDNTPKMQQKVLSLKLMATTLEALIAFQISIWFAKSESTASNINSLFKTYLELYEFCKRLTKPKKGENNKKKDNNTTDTTIIKKSRSRTLKLPPTIIDIESAHKIICLLYRTVKPNSPKGQIAVLKQRSEFHLYSLRTCISIFQSAQLLHTYERHKHWEKYKMNYLEIGELLFTSIVMNIDTIREFNEDVALLGLECFKELCELLCSTFNVGLLEFLIKINKSSSSQELGIQLNAFIVSMQGLIDAYYDGEVDEDSVMNKSPLIIFEIISLLMHKVILHNTKINQIFEWLKKWTKSDKLDSAITIIVLQLITMIEEREVDHGKILDEMSVKLCTKFGSIDDSEIDINEEYNIFDDCIILQAHTIFNNSIKIKINNAAWVLGRLKAEHTYASTAGISDESHRDQLKLKERSLCRHLSYTIQTLESLANARVTPGLNTDLTFKNLQLIYSTLNILTKYFVAKSTAQNPAFQAVKFIQVVQLAGKSLKTTVYNFITYTEENQNNNHRADVHALRNKVKKETKRIPIVVYEIEQFQKEILALEKKTGTSLDNYIKHSITRDFRIKHSELTEGLEKLGMTQITQSQHREIIHSPSESESTTKESNIDSVPLSKRPKFDD